MGDLDRVQIAKKKRRRRKREGGRKKTGGVSGGDFMGEGRREG